MLTREQMWEVGANENQYGFYCDLGQLYFHFDSKGQHYLADASGKKLADMSLVKTIDDLRTLKRLFDTRL